MRTWQTSIISITILILFVTEIECKIDLEVLPGFNGYYKQGHWTPIRVALFNDGDELEADVKVELPNRSYSSAINLSTNVRKVLHLYILPERRNFPVKLVRGEQVLTQEYVSLTSLNPNDIIILVISSAEETAVLPQSYLNQAQSESVNEAMQMEGDKSSIYVVYCQVELLPDSGKGYDPIDVVLLDSYSLRDFSEEQENALTDWVNNGGKLIVSGGLNSPNYRDTFVEKLLPVRIVGTKLLDTSLLGTYSDDSLGKIRSVVASFELVKGGTPILTDKNGYPMVLERKIGLGRCIFLSYDYRDPAFRSWEYNRTLLNQILSAPNDRVQYTEMKKIFPDRELFLPSYKPLGILLLAYLSIITSVTILKKGKFWIYAVSVSVAFVLIYGLLYGKNLVVLREYSIVTINNDLKRASLQTFLKLSVPSSQDIRLSIPGQQEFFVTLLKNGDKTISARIDSYKGRDHYVKLHNLLDNIVYAETCIDTQESIQFYPQVFVDRVEGTIKNNLKLDLSDCFLFYKGSYKNIGMLRTQEAIKLELQKAFSGDPLEYYVISKDERSKFFELVKKDSVLKVSDTGFVIGFLEGSALKDLVGIDIKGDHKLACHGLVIVYL